MKIIKLIVITTPLLLPLTGLADLSSGLVAFYALNGNGNNSASASLNLTEYNITYQPGLFGLQAASFNGNTSYMRTSDNMPITGTTSRSIDVWVNANSFWNYKSLVQWGTWSTPASAGTSWAFFLQPPNQGAFLSAHWVDFASTPSAGAYGSNTWMNLAATFDGGSRTVKFYLNGDYVGGSLVLGDTANIDTTLGPLTVGNNDTSHPPYSDVWYSPWDGLMQNLRIYDRVLTSDEIAALSVVPEPNILSLLFLSSIALAVKGKFTGANRDRRLS